MVVMLVVAVAVPLVVTLVVTVVVTVVVPMGGTSVVVALGCSVGLVRWVFVKEFFCGPCLFLNRRAVVEAIIVNECIVLVVGAFTFVLSSVGCAIPKSVW